MPNPIDPGLLARLMGLSPNSHMTDGGLTYHAYAMNPGPSGEAGAGQEYASPTGGFYAYDQNKSEAGDPLSWYGSDGAYSHEGQIRDMSGLDPLLLAFLAAAGGMAAFLPGGFAAGAAAGSGGAGAAGASGAAPGFSTLPGGGFSFGAVDATAIPGWATAGGAAGGAAGAAAGGGTSTMPSLAMPNAPALAETVPAAFSGAGGSGLTGLLQSHGGLLASALGAASGAQGQEESSTASKSVPDWIKNFYVGNNGLLPMAQNLLTQQMSPERMAQVDLIRNLGMGLMQTPQQRYFGQGGR